MIKKEHTRNQKRMYRIHKQEELIEKQKYIIGHLQQELKQREDTIDRIEEYLNENDYEYVYQDCKFIETTQFKDLKEILERGKNE